MLVNVHVNRFMDIAFTAFRNDCRILYHVSGRIGIHYSSTRVVTNMEWGTILVGVTKPYTMMEGYRLLFDIEYDL